jgi:hypothetical protein
MIPLSTATAGATSGALTFTRISCNRNYELKQNGAVVGRLTRPSMWSQKFVVETADGSWTFRRSGFWNNRGEILDGSGQVIASFNPQYGSSALTFADGQVFRFSRKGWWRPVWTAATENGQPILYVQVREKTIELAAGAAVPGARLALVSMFVWYRIQQAEEDAAAAAVMVAAGA